MLADAYGLGGGGSRRTLAPLPITTSGSGIGSGNGIASSRIVNGRSPSAAAFQHTQQEASLWRVASSLASARQRRHPPLYNSAVVSLGITEVEIIKRLLMATMAGAAIGFERRYSERPAGLRTMALVSLGAAIFTIISFGIPGDRSRMAASVASGVGFIGAGVISQNGFEESSKGGGNGRRIQQVNGLTTATAIWVSAALGVSSGIGLNLLTCIGAFLAVCVLRVGRFTRVLRLRRRDFQKFTESFSATSKAAAELKKQQQQPIVASATTGAALHSPPQSDSPYLVMTKAPAPPSSSSSSKQQQQQKKKTTIRAREQEDAGADDHQPLGPSKTVPPPVELYETTTAGGLGSQEIRDGGGSGGGDAGGMMFSGNASEAGDGPPLGIGDVGV